MLQAFLKLADKIFLHFIFIGLGLSLSELSLRLIGFQSWRVTPNAEMRDSFFQRDDFIGWIPQASLGGLFTGKNFHTETLLPNRTRFVANSSEQPKAPGVLILGDSSIYGWGLSDEETFASRLAAKLPNYKVVNAAVPGYGALQSFLWMQRLIPEIRPNYVILGYGDYYINRDVEALDWVTMIADLSSKNNAFIPYANIRQGLLEVVPPKSYFLELPGRNLFAIARILEMIFASCKGMDRLNNRVEISKEIFRSWQNSVRAAGAEPVVMFWVKDKSRELFEDFLLSLKVKVMVCIHPNQGTTSTVLEKDNHPSAIVPSFWADCVSEKLLQIVRN